MPKESLWTARTIQKRYRKKRGNFAIVVSKAEIDKSGAEEQKIKFDDDKLIMHVDKRDLIEMINYKINNQDAEDILERKIADLSI